MDAVNTGISTREHGGKLEQASRKFARPLEEWIDLSTGINPLPYPVRTVSEHSWSRLPEQGAYDALCDAASRYLGCPSREVMAIAPGTQSLIQVLPHMRSYSRVGVVSPTYNEHAHAWKEAGHDVVEITELEDAGKDVDVVVIVNPNNPDGRTWSRETLLTVADELASRGGWLVVDEAFCDVTPGISIASCAGRPGLVILRSFGKFFGLAGIRLGLVLAAPGFCDLLRRRLGPWAIAGPALEIGERAYADDAWIAEARKRLEDDRKRLSGLLERSGGNVIGGTDLFLLVRFANASAVFEELAQAGILVRNFSYCASWLRFGLPGREDAWVRLEKALP